ncbi:hypothetical protein [Parasphingorhabdus sp.]|uniref:hypothetical protein n=1 Tax=Parasphingorhabdus sp. TaxID=2709688 RepID=UPI003A91FEC9
MDSPEETVARMTAAQNWREPYRSRDMSGGNETASRVAWDWVNEVAIAAQCENPEMVGIEQAGSDGGMTLAVYRSTELLAVAHVFRDIVNFSVLIRWKSPALLEKQS